MSIAERPGPQQMALSIAECQQMTLNKEIDDHK